MPWLTMMRMIWSIFLLRDWRAPRVVFYVAEAPMSTVAKSGFTLISAFPDTLILFKSQQLWARAIVNNAIRKKNRLVIVLYY
jgi:hypothetical protein